MTTTVLVTGGTGTLGRAVAARLRVQGHEARVLSRRPGPDTLVGDLETGAGIAEAVRGVDAVVHAATRFGRDVVQARTLLDALRDRGADAPHLVFVSIVGVDRVPLRYYRDKVRVEQLVAAADGPWTVLRATQFHDLLTTLFAGLGRVPPVLPVLAGARFQPIDVHDVADRLTGLVSGPPVRGIVELAGPRVETMADLARTWRRRPGGVASCCPCRCRGGWPRRCAPGDCSIPRTPTARSRSRSSWRQAAEAPALPAGPLRPRGRVR